MNENCQLTMILAILMMQVTMLELFDGVLQEFDDNLLV